jgi:hypothetical protein
MSSQGNSNYSNSSPQSQGSQESSERVQEEVLNYYIDEYLRNMESGMYPNQSYQSEFTVAASQRSDDESTEILSSQGSDANSHISSLVDRAVADSQVETSIQTDSSQLSTNSVDYNLYKASRP